MFNFNLIVLTLCSFALANYYSTHIDNEIHLNHDEESGERSSGISMHDEGSSFTIELEEEIFIDFTTKNPIEDESDLVTLYTLEEIEADCEMEEKDESFETITSRFESENSASGSRKGSESMDCDDEDNMC